MSIFSDGHAAMQAFNPQAGWVFAAIFGVLLLASAIAPMTAAMPTAAAAAPSPLPF